MRAGEVVFDMDAEEDCPVDGCSYRGRTWSYAWPSHMLNAHSDLMTVEGVGLVIPDA